jgi:hypothetical protein
MDQKEAALYQATKMFNWTETEAKERLFDGEELKEDYADVILEADKARVAKLKEERTTYHDTGFKKAEKQFKTYAEETFKKLTNYNGTEDNFEAMFSAWYETEKKKLVKNVEVNEDTVKKHPAYIALETTTIPKQQFDDLQKAFDEFKTQGQKAQVMGVVTGRAWDVVSAANPILSDNPQVAENRRRDFLAKFSGYDYELTDDNKIIVSKDGKRLEDEHANHKPFEAFVMELAGMNFDFQAQGDKGNAGNKGGGSGGAAFVITEKPTTKAEYNAAINKLAGLQTDEAAKQRIAIKRYYDEHKKD